MTRKEFGWAWRAEQQTPGGNDSKKDKSRRNSKSGALWEMPERDTMTERSLMRKLLLVVTLCGLLCWFHPAGLGQQAAAGAGAGSGKTHRVVFAVTSGEEADWNMTMGNLRNLIAGVKPDPYEIEVVAYGPGILMVKGDSTVAKEIAELQAQGVRFVACQNAMRARHLEVKDLLPGVTPVPAGIVEVVTKQEQGWVYIHGGR